MEFPAWLFGEHPDAYSEREIRPMRDLPRGAACIFVFAPQRGIPEFEAALEQFSKHLLFSGIRIDAGPFLPSLRSTKQSAA